jgi:hypothetical protein
MIFLLTADTCDFFFLTADARRPFAARPARQKHVNHASRVIKRSASVCVSLAVKHKLLEKEKIIVIEWLKFWILWVRHNSELKITERV